MQEQPGKTAGPAPTLIFRPPSYFSPLDAAQLFPRRQPVEVELGSGDGSFVARWAAAHPEMNFIGVERLLGRLRKLDRKGLRLGLTNLRLLRIEAGYFIQYLSPAKSIQAIHVYFPDPWPKRKHRKNRLINEQFALAAAAALIPAGAVFLRTDSADYFAQMKEVFETHGRFRAVETPPGLAVTLTDFERGFQNRGVATLRVAYQLD